MKKHLITGTVILATLFANAQEHQLVKKWETDSLLKVPEGALYDAENKVIYVSNIDGQPWEKDNKGSVGKVGLDGKIITVDWVSGLQAPKGMALYKNNLYVADVDKVAVIDIKNGTIAQTIPVEGAERLNDITVDKKGVLYVSDSKVKRVHRIENGQATTWLDSLKGPNGVLINGNDLFVLDAGGLYKVEKDKTFTKLADGMEGGTDGVEHVKGKDYIVSCWAGAIWYVKGDGTKQNLLDTRAQKINTADIGYDAKNRIVYVPTFFKNSLVAYELK
ncbi:ATP/GTP-binding protein [Niastella caeni]|uniref:ATP/GTP-binding protein n=1 Tax=Niastella caeni TaxID=2569763 RepID=A0A4S8HUV7_9BACT|nr:SMP-30/gluconolactonase/LRE family protein [Niastella caeni]THU38439.1 ATP/GTP-binding protein [Niastella caeni]